MIEGHERTRPERREPDLEPPTPTPTPRDEFEISAVADPELPPLLAEPRALVGVLVAAAFVFVLAPYLSSFLQRVGPGALTVGSLGTNFPNLGHALPFTLRASAVTVSLGAVVTYVAARVKHKVEWTDRATTAALVFLVLCAAAIYGWFGLPHNALPTNSRWHWVDIYFDRRENWYYTLVKYPHMLFYDNPYILQGLNAALNVSLMYAVGRAAFRSSRLISVLLALSLLASSLVLMFANTAEDVQLNLAVLLLALLFYIRRSTPWLGLALFVVVLGRPQLIGVWGAVVLAELLVGERREGAGRIRSVISDRFVVVNLAVASALFVVWDLFLVVRHQNWLLHNGVLIDNYLTSLKPISFEGFKIAPFSGVYLLHSLWMYPFALWIAAGVALFRARELPVTARRALVFALIVVMMGLLISEAEPLSYYNVRYLTYGLPFLMVAAFAVFDLPRSTNRRPIFGVAGLAALLCLSVTTTRWIALDERRALLATPISRAYSHRSTIKSIIGDAPAGTTAAGIGTRNYISYLLRRPLKDITYVPRRGSDFHGYVFTTTAVVPIGEVVWRDEPLILVKVP